MSNSRDPSRGNTRDRAARKRWLIEMYGPGDGTIQCAHCPSVLTYDTLTVDRIVPGALGGRYTRDNIRPSCAPCASAQGSEVRDSR